MDTVALQHQAEGVKTISRLPVDSETHKFQQWTISYTKSHILKSVCINNGTCVKDNPECCELCVYNFALELPHLPDMVFHKNRLSVVHENGARLEFTPMDALRHVKINRAGPKVACAEEWKESRPADLTTEKVRPFDWTFSTDYQGTLVEGFKVESTEQKIDMFKLMRRESILFYHDLTLFEDELHDHGVSSCSVKIRVMPSGFYVLLRNFIRVDGVMLRLNDTRFHYDAEANANFILKEFSSREAKVEQLKHVPPSLFTNPQDISDYLPVTTKFNEKLLFA